MNYEEKQSWLCNQIVKEAQDVIIMADREGIIHLWNKGAEIVFGFSPVEAIGQSLHIIIPESLRERHDQGYHEVIQSGETKYSHELLAVPALKKDGNRISVEFTMRKNIPTHELRDFVAEMEKAPKGILYPRDPSLDPQLVWKGKDEQDAQPLEVPSVPIYIQEKILPKAIIEEVRAEAQGGRVLTLFLHSSELLPGGSPDFPDAAAVDRLVAKFQAFLAWLVKRGPVTGLTLSGLHDLLASNHSWPRGQ